MEERSKKEEPEIKRRWRSTADSRKCRGKLKLNLGWRWMDLLYGV